VDTQALYTTAHAVYSLHYHLVLVTKYRRRVLSPDRLARFAAIADQTTALWGGRLHEANGEPDHVHALVTLPPQVALSRFVNNLKTVTSRRLRREFPGLRGAYKNKAVLWTASYFVSSAGGAPLEVLKQYVQNQGT
jgi:putative transposase